MAIRILTDSTSDITQSQAKELGVVVVPLTVTFGNETFHDGVDITNEEFYKRLAIGTIIPSTAQPSPGEFVEIIKREMEPGDTIVCVHISSRISGTIESCKIAAEMLGDEYKFEFIDSGETSASLGLFVLRLNKMVKNGASIDEIMAVVPKIKENVQLIVTVGSLKFLEKNGRIGKSASYFAGLLNIKPLIQVADGLIAPLAKARGNIQKVCGAIIDNMYEMYGDEPLEIMYFHTGMPEYLQAIRSSAQARLNIAEEHESLVGPVIGSHSGPFTVGLAVLPINL